MTRKSRVRYANWGWNGWQRGLCFLFFPQYLISFANKTGSKIKKHVWGITRGGWGGGVRPFVEGYNPQSLGSGRNPALDNGSYTPPRTSPSVFLILIEHIITRLFWCNSLVVPGSVEEKEKT